MIDNIPLNDLLSKVIDNRGRTCPTAEEGMPLIATNCVHNTGLYPTFEKVRHVDQVTYDNWFRGHPEPGDLIFVLKGTPGRVCLTPDPVPFCIAQDMVALRANPERVDPAYLFAALRSPETQEAIGNLHVGSMIAHFKKGDFNRLTIPLPDRETQKSIGRFYFDVSRKIELNRRMSATLEEMARALYRSWFVDFDPVHARALGQPPAHIDPTTAALFPDSFGPDGLPKGWEAGTLMELAQLNPEKWSKRSHPDEVRYLDLANVKRGAIETVSYYQWDEAPSRARMVLRKGDTIVGTVRPGNGSYTLIHVRGLTGSTGFAVLRAKNERDIPFLYCASTSSENIDRLTNLADGAAYPAVRPEVVGKTGIVLAPDTVCDAFSRMASPWLERCGTLAEEAVSLAALRDTLLPRLMSGELRIRKAERLIEEVLS